MILLTNEIYSSPRSLLEGMTLAWIWSGLDHVHEAHILANSPQQKITDD